MFYARSPDQTFLPFSHIFLQKIPIDVASDQCARIRGAGLMRTGMYGRDDVTKRRQYHTSQDCEILERIHVDVVHGSKLLTNETVPASNQQEQAVLAKRQYT
jgi:hypothetical protein